MRFIIGFIFFGLLFYGISVYFPDAFQTLVTWAAQIFDFLRGIVDRIMGRVHHENAPPPTTTESLLFLYGLWRLR